MADNKDKKVLNVPALRFPEFNNEWSKDILQNVVAFSNGKAHENCVDENGCYILVNSKFVSTEGSVIKKVTLQLSPLFKSQFVMVMSDLPNGKALAKCFYIEEDNIYTLNQRICSFTAQNGNFSRFLMYQINRNKYYLRYDDGINQTNLKKGEVLACPVFIPSIQEQTKIATFIHLLDKRIATQNKIIDKLQSLIKGLVDSILENPSWEKVYLCSFMQFYSTNSLSWEQLSYSNGNVRNLHYGLIHGFQTSMIDSTLLPRILPNYLPKQYTVCQDGDVVFTDASEDTNEIGKAIELSNTINVKTVCGLHTIHGRDIKQNTIVGFKGFAFNSRYFHDQVRRLAQGTKVYSITAKNLSSCYVYIPDMIKQENIVRLLNAYEENLSLNRTLLNKYEIQKQYLLQQMLI